MSTNPIIKLMDTPGLMDTGSSVADEENIEKIVKHVSALGYVNSFILVVNEQVPRFDAAMQDAIKLIVDSFGSKCLSNLGIVYTRAIGTVSPAESFNRTAEYTKLIAARTAIHIHSLPSWQVDCKPTELRKLGVPEERINDRIVKRDSTLDEIIRWSRDKIPVYTQDAVIKEYEQRKRAREEEEKRKEEEAKRIYDASVISTFTETKTEEYIWTSEPIFQGEQMCSEEWTARWFGKVIGKTCSTEQVHVANKVTISKREAQRTVNTLGSGMNVTEDWVTVREWTDVN